MKIWELRFEVDKYDNLRPYAPWDIDYIQTFDGRPHQATWQPVKVVRMEPEEKRPLSNAPGFHSPLPVFDRCALDVLNEYLDGAVEVLPLINEEGDYYAINVLKVLDCIDYGKSEYKTFSNSTRIMRFVKYIFKEEVIKNSHIFKTRETTLNNPFVSDEFKNAVTKSSLTGFKFRLIWDSDVE